MPASPKKNVTGFPRLKSAIANASARLFFYECDWLTSCPNSNTKLSFLKPQKSFGWEGSRFLM